jgi:hypothetical protein
MDLSLYSQTRVISGKEIDIKDAPWTANMRIVNAVGVKLFDRSGIIISENLVLTASHNWPACEYSHLTVHVGGASDGVGQYCKVHRFIHHSEKDITLLELEEPLKFDDNIQAIDYKSCVDESLYAPGADAMIYGWGRTIPNLPSQSLKLRAARVKIISRDEANAIYGISALADGVIFSTGNDTICMGGKGDSGGPLVVRDSQQKPVLAGVAIYADTREITENSGLTVYSKVKPMIEWLDAHRCEIVGADTVSSLGSSFAIANMPPDAISVEWTCSGLTEIRSTMNDVDVIPSETKSKIEGYIGAKINTNNGTLAVYKDLAIMPRIDIDINIRYNAATAKYEMVAKTVNMEAVDDKDILKCKNIADDVKFFGFVWTYEDNIAVGQEVVFEINPNPPVIHTIDVRKYGCDHTVGLKKNFFIHHADNKFVTVSNEPGIISIRGAHLSVDVDSPETLQLTYSKNGEENSVSLNTSHVRVENPSVQIVDDENYEVLLYSRTGNLLYSGNFDSRKNPLHIDTSALYPDVYVLHIRGYVTGKIMSRLLVIN